MGSIKARMIPFKLTKKNLSMFKRISIARDINESAVRNIIGALKKGEYVSVFIKVYKSGRNYYIIDGQHRLEAFKRIVDKNPSFTWDIYLIEIEAPPEKIFEIYWWENVLRRQNVATLLKAYKEIGIYKEFFKIFDDICTFGTRRSNKVPYTYILGAIAHYQGISTGELNPKNTALVKKVIEESLKEKFILQKLKEFSKLWLESIPYSAIPFNKAIFIAMANLYLKGKLTKNQFKKLLNDKRFINYASSINWVANNKNLKALEEFIIQLI